MYEYVPFIVEMGTRTFFAIIQNNTNRGKAKSTYSKKISAYSHCLKVGRGGHWVGEGSVCVTAGSKPEQGLGFGIWWFSPLVRTFSHIVFAEAFYFLLFPHHGS